MSLFPSLGAILKFAEMHLCCQSDISGLRLMNHTNAGLGLFARRIEPNKGQMPGPGAGDNRHRQTD